MLVTLLALGVAVLSAGAGHGSYGAARALFPLPMLLTLVEGSIGPISGGLALLQFPLYGALLGWCRLHEWYGALILAAFLHLAATVICFSGVLPNFS
jgi:hypothetical protein